MDKINLDNFIKKKWICPKCCWFDGKKFCKKGKDYNFDGEGITGVSSCAGFIKIPMTHNKHIGKNNMTNFDKFAQDIGFNNGKDFCNLVGKVDRSDAIFRLWFSEWRSDRKNTLPFTKDGLLMLLQKIKKQKEKKKDIFR